MPLRDVSVCALEAAVVDELLPLWVSDAVGKTGFAGAFAIDEDVSAFDESLEYVIQDSKVILSKEVRHTIWQVSPHPDEPGSEDEEQAA